MSDRRVGRGAAWVSLQLLAIAALLGFAAGAAAGRAPTGSPRVQGSCGSVVVQGVLRYRLTITRGTPSCEAVRRIAQRYGHPKGKNPRFFCSSHAYECEYSIYPSGWRCGGLFQGYFQCWHGADSPLKASEVFQGSEVRVRSGVGGVWMAGPGCGGGYEWFRHPEAFPYFCDGSAVLEKARWRDWGAPKATAQAVLNEAALNSHNNVATAPRRRTNVTIVASRIELCGYRHVYTRIVIKLAEPVKGIKKLEEAELLPKCSAPA